MTTEQVGRIVLAYGRVAALMAGLLALGVSARAETAPAAKPDWDQVENVKEAATHIAKLQRREGAQKAIAFIDACYRTHKLASAYNRSFEGCIVRDFVLSQALAGIYANVPAEELMRRGAPSAEQITRMMGQRVALAFKEYGIEPKAADEFRVLIETHGFPIFMAIVFPDGKANSPAATGGDASGEPKKSE